MTMKIEFPNGQTIEVTHLVIDYSGTIAFDGKPLAGVTEKLCEIAKQLKIVVLTADTYGTAFENLKGMPCEIHKVSTGSEKAEFVRRIGAKNVLAVGNGQNDVKMVRDAAIGIAVIGDEGASGDLVRAAKVIVQNICTALDLVLNPVRLVATLRK